MWEPAGYESPGPSRRRRTTPATRGGERWQPTGYESRARSSSSSGRGSGSVSDRRGGPSHGCFCGGPQREAPTLARPQQSPREELNAPAEGRGLPNATGARGAGLLGAEGAESHGAEGGIPPGGRSPGTPAPGPGPIEPPAAAGLDHAAEMPPRANLWPRVALGAALLLCSALAVGAWAGGVAKREQAAALAAAAVTLAAGTMLCRTTSSDAGTRLPLSSQRLGSPEAQALRAAFARADAADLGSLDEGQVLAAVRELFPGCARHRHALRWARAAADIDRDGRIDRAEFDTLCSLVIRLNNLWLSFEALEADGERRVGCDEFVLGCSMLETPIARDLAEAGHRKLLEEEGTVTFDSFCVWCAQHQATQQGEPELEPEPGSGAEPQPQPGSAREQEETLLQRALASPSERQALEQLCKRCADLALPAPRDNEAETALPFVRPATLLRFLRARGGSVDKAEAMFRRSVAWRRDSRLWGDDGTVGTAAKAWLGAPGARQPAAAQVCLRHWHGGVHGTDRRGAPVVYTRFGTADPARLSSLAEGAGRALGDARGGGPLMRQCVAGCEVMQAIGPALSRRAGKHIDSFIEVIDLGADGEPGWLRRALAAARHFASIATALDANYPEWLIKKCIYSSHYIRIAEVGSHKASLAGAMDRPFDLGLRSTSSGSAIFAALLVADVLPQSLLAAAPHRCWLCESLELDALAHGVLQTCKRYV